MSLKNPSKRLIEGVGLGLTIVIGYFYIPKNTFEFMTLILAFFLGAMLAESYFKNKDFYIRIPIDLVAVFLGCLVAGLDYAMFFTSIVAVSGLTFWAIIALSIKIFKQMFCIRKKVDFTELRK